jgi:beta-lactamase class A
MQFFPVVRIFAAAALSVGASAHAQLNQEIARIAARAQGRVGVACALPGTALDCDLHSGDAFPMQSVYKLPIAMAMLHAVERGRFRLDQTVRFVPSDRIAPDQYSPLQSEHPQANIDVPIEDLLRRAVSDSDGVASDMLMRTLGGPAGPDRYLRVLGIRGVHIMDSEKTLGREEKLEDRDSAEPRALVALLRMLADRSPLSLEHTHLLLRWMTSSHTGDRRIKALLPAATVVADKTGTSGQGRRVTNATNDAALITLPDGHTLALVVMVADSNAPGPERERVIAEIGKAVYAAAVR